MVLYNMTQLLGRENLALQHYHDQSSQCGTLDEIMCDLLDKFLLLVRLV